MKETKMLRKLIVTILSVTTLHLTAQAELDFPQASSLYLYRSTLWEKTVTTNSSGTENIVSTLSKGGQSNNSATPSGTTRHFHNGTVTYSPIWSWTTKNYVATPAFKAPYLPGWTITTSARYTSSFALDFRIPSASKWNGHLDILLELKCQPVDGRGQDFGSVQRKYYDLRRYSGQSGRLLISPYDQSYVVGRNAPVHYWMYDDGELELDQE